MPVLVNAKQGRIFLMQLDRFLEPCANLPPAGSDLDASGEILALDMLAKWGAADAETDWPALLSAAEAAMEQSRDLRAAAYLTAALLPVKGIGEFCDGLNLIRSLLERFWEEVHPCADEDGDFMERSSALFNLTNYHKVLQPLRTAILVQFQPVGRFSLLDIEIATGTAEVPADYPGTPPNTATIAAAFQNADATEMEARVTQVTRAIADTEAVESIFRDHAGLEQAPDMNRLRDMLRRVLATLKAHLPDTPSASDALDTESAAIPGDSQTTAPAAARVPGEIRTRQDAMAAMDAISKYFRTHEPSSPVPLLMARTKRLVDMDFMAILQDIAPEAVAPMKKLHGDATEG